MNTVDGLENEDYIPLKSVQDKTGAHTRESKVVAGNREVKSDNDSEEAILYERTVQVTYGGGEAGAPADPYTRKIWAGGQNSRV